MKRKSVAAISVLSAAMALLVTPAFAQNWTCRNNDAEIVCASDTCTVTPKGDFTPMSLSVGTDGTLSLCAYSGCWSGTATNTFRTPHYFITIGLNLPWSSPGGATNSVSATINTKTGIGFVLAGNYAHPMTCDVR